MTEEICVIVRIKRKAGKQQHLKGTSDDKEYIRQYEIEPMMELPSNGKVSEHGAGCLCESCRARRERQL